MKSHRLILSAAVAALLVASPRVSHAGLTDLFSRAVEWWQARSVLSSEAEGEGQDADSDAEGEGSEGKPPAGSGKTPGMCAVPREPPRTVCDKGSGFLCVDTPPGGVAGDSFTLRGTVDRAGSVLAGIRISVQNEYTKKTESVDTSSPLDDGCRGELSAGASFCLDADGFFAARVPLSGKGPSTVSVSASRLSGGSVEKRVRTSRVSALSFDETRLSLEPDVKAGAVVEGTHVTATIDLLGDCQFCDFIGASTGGVSVTVENVMTDSTGAVRRIGCPSSVEQGGQGRFVVGVPVGPGKNSLTVTVCNAASKDGACPSVAGIEFEAKGEEGLFKTHSPPPAPSYDSAEFPTIDWEFEAGSSMGGEKNCVQVQFNREAPREICASDDGRYRTVLVPRVGTNVATIIRGGVEEFAWTFGWGRIESPHGADGEITVSNAAAVALPAKTATEILLPLVNNYLASDELAAMLDRLVSGPDADGEEAPKEVAASAIRIPRCDAGGGMEGTKISLRGKPSFEKISIDKLAFRDGGIDVKAILRGLSVGIDLVPDKDGDGKADSDPLPLVVAFRKAIAELSIESGSGAGKTPLILISAPHDDCDYKGKSYCKGFPAALVPENFVGGANSWGGFVSCDVSAARGGAVDACKALNSLNAQTGLVSESVLDAINKALYCDGSAALTRAAVEGVNLGDLGGFLPDVAPRVKLPLKVLLREGLGIKESGLLTYADLVVGDGETYAATPEAFKIAQVGLVTGDSAGVKRFSSAKDHPGDLAASLSLDAVGALLFAASVQGDGKDAKGLLDFDIDEDFFTELGVDFVEECDKFVAVPGGEESAPTICFVRPRVIELLGPPLSTYGYFPAKQPLMLSIRGNRALAPRVALRFPEELPVVAAGEGGESAYSPAGELYEVELGGISLSFYALEVDASKPADEFGNLAVKRDEEGRPLIHSMRPDADDPRDGAIVSFDMTLLLALELGSPEGDAAVGGRFLPLRILADRSRLVVTPVAGSNATTAPAAGLISSLTEKIKLALTSMGTRDDPIAIPVPSNLGVGSAAEGGEAGPLGIERIEFGPEGFHLASDPRTNSISLAVKAAIMQILHVGGKPVEYRVPDDGAQAENSSSR